MLPPHYHLSKINVNEILGTFKFSLPGCLDIHINQKRTQRFQYVNLIILKAGKAELKIAFNSLTHNSPLTQPLFTRSKWNMGDIFGLKHHFLYLHTP